MSSLNNKSASLSRSLGANDTPRPTPLAGLQRGRDKTGPSGGSESIHKRKERSVSPAAKPIFSSRSQVGPAKYVLPQATDEEFRDFITMYETLVASIVALGLDPMLWKSKAIRAWLDTSGEETRARYVELRDYALVQEKDRLTPAGCRRIVGLKLFLEAYLAHLEMEENMPGGEDDLVAEEGEGSAEGWSPSPRRHLDLGEGAHVSDDAEGEVMPSSPKRSKLSSSVNLEAFDKAISTLSKKIERLVVPSLSASSTADEKVEWWDRVEPEAIALADRLGKTAKVFSQIVQGLVPLQLFEEFKFRAGDLPIMPTMGAQVRLFRLHLFQYDLVEEASAGLFASLLWQPSTTTLASFVLQFMKLAERGKVPIQQIRARTQFCFAQHKELSADVRKWAMHQGAGYAMSILPVSRSAAGRKLFGMALLQLVERLYRIHDLAAPVPPVTPVLPIIPPQPPALRPQRDERPPRREERECFYCNFKGHLVKECRKKIADLAAGIDQRHWTGKGSNKRERSEPLQDRSPSKVRKVFSESDKAAAKKFFNTVGELDPEGTARILSILDTSVDEFE
jgi:hypothetical protein